MGYFDISRIFCSALVTFELQKYTPNLSEELQAAIFI